MKIHKTSEIKRSFSYILPQMAGRAEVQRIISPIDSTRTYRGRQYTVDFSEKIKVEIFVEDYLAIAMVQELATAAKVGEADDLIITLSSIEETSDDS